MNRTRTLTLCLTVLLVATGCSGPGQAPATTTVTQTVAATPTSSNSSPEETAAQPQTQTQTEDENGGETASGSATSGPRIVDVDAFRTPSKNILCDISSSGVGCQVVQNQWNEPGENGCPNANGVALDDRGASLICGDFGDSTPQVVDYGTRVSKPPYRCDIKESGVRCTNTTTGEGFQASRGSYRLFD